MDESYDTQLTAPQWIRITVDEEGVNHSHAVITRQDTSSVK